GGVVGVAGWWWACFRGGRSFWWAASSRPWRSSPSSSSSCWRAPKASPARPCNAACDGMEMPITKLRPDRADALGGRATRMLGATLPFLALLVVGVAFPMFGGGYWGVIANRACVYWVLVSRVNLVVSFAVTLAI